MRAEGPSLEKLTRRLADCPADVLAEPRLGGQGRVRVAAVVNDLLHDLGGPPLTSAQAQDFEPRRRSQDARNRLRLVLLACWLLSDPDLRSTPDLPRRALKFLTEDLLPLAGLVPADRAVSEPERREEFARLALNSLDLRPAGESEAQAQDRLATLDSAERRRVIAAAQAAEARAREIREAMARQAALDAEAKTMRE